MSSSTSDSSLNTSMLDTIAGYISYIQQRNIFTTERFRTVRRYICQSIGLYVLLYCFFRLLFAFYFFLKLIFNYIVQMLSLIVFLPFKSIALVLPKTTSYNILFPSIWICSIISFFIAKLSYKNIESYFGKHHKLIKRYSFTVTFVILLLLQSVLILLPLTLSVNEQKKSLLNTNVFKQPVRNIADKKRVVDVNTQINTPMDIVKPIRRVLSDNQQQELPTISKNMKNNENSQGSKSQEMSDSHGTHTKVESNIEDDHSHLTDHVNQNMSKIEELIQDKISLGKEGHSSLEQDIDYASESAREFSSQFLEKSSNWNEANIEQIEEILPDQYKEETTKLSANIKLEEQETLTWRETISDWLDDAWNIWYQTKLDFQQLFPMKTKSTESLSQHDISSNYLGYTDLRCYDYTKSIYYSRSYKQKYRDFLHTYRHSSPFPIYISILKSNGPQCFDYNPNSSCAIDRKLYASSSKIKFYRQIQYLMIIVTLIFILRFIYRTIRNRKYKAQSSNQKQVSTLNKVHDSPSQEKLSDKTKTPYPLDVKLEKDLRSWLEYEKDHGYQKLSESYRTALNSTFSKSGVSNSSL